MIEDIRVVQDSIETAEISAIESVDNQAMDAYMESVDEARMVLTGFSISNAEAVVDRWRLLGDRLIARYDDGFVNSPGSMAHEVGYPGWWLEQGGYSDGPVDY